MLLAFSLGPAEVAIILAIVILVFGPSKLPQLGASVGKMLRGFKKEMKALEDETKADAEADEGARPEIDVTPQKPDEKAPTQG